MWEAGAKVDMPVAALSPRCAERAEVVCFLGLGGMCPSFWLSRKIWAFTSFCCCHPRFPQHVVQSVSCLCSSLWAECCPWVSFQWIAGTVPMVCQ